MSYRRSFVCCYPSIREARELCPLQRGAQAQPYWVFENSAAYLTGQPVTIRRRVGNNIAKLFASRTLAITTFIWPNLRLTVR